MHNLFQTTPLHHGFALSICLPRSTFLSIAIFLSTLAVWLNHPSSLLHPSFSSKPNTARSLFMNLIHAPSLCSCCSPNASQSSSRTISLSPPTISPNCLAGVGLILSHAYSHPQFILTASYNSIALHSSEISELVVLTRIRLNLILFALLLFELSEPHGCDGFHELHIMGISGYCK